MALTKDSTGYYLEPTTGQYYSPYTAPTRGGFLGSNSFGSYMGMGGFQQNDPYARFGVSNNMYTPPSGLMTFNGQSYVPFSGNAAGISQGKRSVVDAMIVNRQPYEYNVPTLAELFPSMQGAMQPMAMPQGNQMATNTSQLPSAGAGRFMGGLLGSMPTPVSTTTTQAPSSSGAGRYL
jgi:hypothetical protein